MHELVRQTVEGEKSIAHLASLLRSWRNVRTSELADVIEELSRRRFGEHQAHDLTTMDGVNEWCEAVPTATFYELGWLLQSFGDQAMNSWERGDQERYWTGLTRCVELVVGLDPDPRVGRAVEDALRGPGAYWFRPYPFTGSGGSQAEALQVIDLAPLFRVAFHS